MEPRDPELPLATLRPGHLQGRVASTRGELGRWLRARRRGIDGRSLPLILTGVVFCGMMLAMGQVADRAHRAGTAIDEAHRDQRTWDRARGIHGGALFRGSWTTTDPWGAGAGRSCDHDQVELDGEPRSGAAAATTAVGRNAALFYIVAGKR